MYYNSPNTNKNAFNGLLFG